MASVNQAIILGNIGQEPKVMQTQNENRKVVSFSVATTERGYIKKDGTKSEDITDWHNIILFGNLAEIGAKYLHKGMMVYIQGKIKNRAYNDKNGQKRYVTEIIADSMQMLSKVETAPDKMQVSASSNAISQPEYFRTPIPPEMQGKSVAEILAQKNGIEDELPF